MIKLRKILLCDWIFIGIFLVTLVLLIIRINTKKNHYSIETKQVEGIIINIIEQEDKETLEVKAKEKLLVQLKTKNKNLNLGDKVYIEGIFTEPSENTTEYLFNYKKYLKHKNIYFIVKANTITLVKKNHNIYYYIKQIIKKHLGKNPYLNTFLIGNKTYLSEDIIRSYQENGISHLFAISGMHISLLASILEKLLKKKQEQVRFYTISSVLMIYLLLVGFSPSISRGVLFYVFFQINKIWYFYIKPMNIILLVSSICLLFHPEFIWDTGFQYSYLISISLILMNKEISSPKYINSLLKTSILSSVVSIPISIYNYYQINLLGIFYNLIYVPYISFIVFPFSIIVFIITPLRPLYNLLTFILEKSSLLLSNINIGKIIFKRLPIPFYIVYLCLVFFYLKYKYKIIIWIYILILLIHTQIPYIQTDNYVHYIDVGQGDATFIHLDHKSILIDSGGNSNQEGKVFYNIIYPYLKSHGIRKLTLILSHGDYDHMGEAINIVNNFKVEKVILNCGEFNNLEKELIKVLEQKRIPYYSCIEELKVKKSIFYFLQTKEYNNENDNSNVIYFQLNNIKFLFMGDAGIEKEKDIIEEYSISNIDVLKVGHHGSKTCSGKEFIQEMNPKYAIISVGKNNRYGHPNKEVLNNLEDSKIYRTDKDGSIMLKIKNNKLKIET